MARKSSSSHPPTKVTLALLLQHHSDVLSKKEIQVIFPQTNEKNIHKKSTPLEFYSISPQKIFQFIPNIRFWKPVQNIFGSVGLNKPRNRKFPEFSCFLGDVWRQNIRDERTHFAANGYTPLKSDIQNDAILERRYIFQTIICCNYPCHSVFWWCVKYFFLFEFLVAFPIFVGETT